MIARWVLRSGRTNPGGGEGDGVGDECTVTLSVVTKAMLSPLTRTDEQTRNNYDVSLLTSHANPV